MIAKLPSSISKTSGQVQFVALPRAAGGSPTRRLIGAAGRAPLRSGQEDTGKFYTIGVASAPKSMGNRRNGFVRPVHRADRDGARTAARSLEGLHEAAQAPVLHAADPQVADAYVIDRPVPGQAFVNRKPELVLGQLERVGRNIGGEPPRGG